MDRTKYGVLYRSRGISGEPGLVDKVLALHAGSRGFDSHRGHMSERFFRSNRPGYPHPVSSELENSGIRVAVGDCSVTERRRWRPPYQTGKTVHVHAKHYKHNEDGRMAPGVCGNGFVPLSHSGNVVTRIGIHPGFLHGKALGAASEYKHISFTRYRYLIGIGRTEAKPPPPSPRISERGGG